MTSSSEISLVRSEALVLLVDPTCARADFVLMLMVVNLAVAVFDPIGMDIHAAGTGRSEALALFPVPSYSRAAFAPVNSAVAVFDPIGMDIRAAGTCRPEALALFPVPSYSRAAFAPVLILISSLAFVRSTVL